MPIRINLLAETQALEEMRRKDPVKRTFIGSVVLVAAVLGWSAVLQFQIIAVNADLGGYQAKWDTMETEYTTAEASQLKLMETEGKLAALEALRTNRFLWGSALNALQQTMNDVNHIQVVRFRSEQEFHVQDATPARTNGAVVIQAQRGKATEKVALFIEATDASTQPGGQVNQFKQSILAVPYFKNNLQRTNGVRLTSLSPPGIDPVKGSSFVKFTLQCVFPDRER